VSRSRRNVVLLAAVVILMWILVGIFAALVYAGPGGGTSGFGGGGGGGGGGFSGGGGGYSGGGGSGSGQGGGTAFLIFVGAFFAFMLFSIISARMTVHRMRRRREARARAVELAAAEAADDDAAFEAGEVRGEAAALLKLLVQSWTARDREAMRRMLAPDLMVEWERRLDDFDRKRWHNVCELQGEPQVEYLGLVNRADDADDRVVVRISSTQRDVVVDAHGNRMTRNDSGREIVQVSEYWTLGKRDGRWILLSIEQDTEGAHNLDSEIVATPWGDDDRLRDEAVTELATSDAVPDDQIAGLADLDFDGSARAAALDLAMVDGRFAPDVLEAAARRAVAAWADAVDGDDAALERAATPEAVRELLYAGDASERTRLVVRGPRLRALRITALHADATPPAMTIEADVSGRRYRENRDTVAVVEGSKDREVTFTERWTMTLDGDSEAPWRISDAGLAPRAAS
jgi:predicted lipid-binding transport protein (Tim44 family)